MTTNNLDLAGIFQQVASALAQNQQTLNQADEINHDHGDHMVQTFQTITGALQEKQQAKPNEALEYAVEMLNQQPGSGSSKLYVQGLSQAARQLQGQELNPEMGMMLLQTLLSGGQPAQPVQPTTQPQQPDAGGLLGGLLSALGGGKKKQQPTNGNGLSDGIDAGDLLNAGMAFLQAKQRGEGNLDAIVNAVASASGMGSQPHRQQSTQLVADTFLQALSRQAGK
jgi:hypothetical protein